MTTGSTAAASLFQEVNIAFDFHSTGLQEFKDVLNSVFESAYLFISNALPHSKESTSSDSFAVISALKSLEEKGVQISDCGALCDYLEDRPNLAIALEVVCDAFLGDSNTAGIQISIYTDAYEDDEYIHVLIDERKHSDSFFETVERAYARIRDCLTDSDGWIQVDRNYCLRS